MAIKAIPTEYGGYWFRSRLEARWAVFFNAIGIPFRYELQGYNLDGIKYLPDFYLPDAYAYIEVKPYNATPDEITKAWRLCLETNNHVFVVEGDPYIPHCHRFSFKSWANTSPSEIAYVNEKKPGIYGDFEHFGAEGVMLSKTGELYWYPFDGAWVPILARNEFRSALDGLPEMESVRPAMLKARQARFEYGETPQ